MNQSASPYKRKLWTPKEKELLAQLFPHHYTSHIAQQLSRSYQSVASTAALMGLKKSPEFMQKELSLQADRLRVIGKKSRFKPGQISHNKGKPMAPEVYAKCAPTMFKKGNLPHNTKYDGHERLDKDGYVEVRIRKGEYIHKHRHIWQEANGPIPPGMLVVFKDGDKLNISLKNLELITAKEHIARNTIQRYPPELRAVIKLKAKLNRKINGKERKERKEQ